MSLLRFGIPFKYLTAFCNLEIHNKQIKVMQFSVNIEISLDLDLQDASYKIIVLH